MSDPDSFETLLRKNFFGDFFDTVDELWDDELENSQVFQFGSTTTITYTYLQQIPSYYVGRPETAAGVFEPVTDTLGLKNAIDILLGNAKSGYEVTALIFRRW